MRNLFTLLIVIGFTVGTFSQVPEKISYQAVIRDASNVLVTNHDLGMRISILQGSASGTAVYVETQNPTTNANGLVTLEIGDGTLVTGTFAEIDWSTGIYFIKIETDQTGGTSYSITGTSQLLSVPYAFYSKNAVDKAYVDALEKNLRDLEDIVYTQIPLPTDGLVAYFPFDGNANDESGNNNHGTVVGATLANDRIGKLNSTYSFNGTSDNKITVSFSTPLNTSNYSGISISAWCKLNNLNSPPYNTLSLLDNSLKGFIMTYDYTDKKFYVAKSLIPLNFTSIRTQNPINANMWYNLVLTSDTTTRILKFYLNGVLQGETALDSFMPNATNLYIGYHNSYDWGLGWWMNGFIDDIRIYDRVISDAEIRLLYHEGGYVAPKMLTDIDGNSYKIVRIGTQIWMAENLKTTKYSNGDIISSGIYVQGSDVNNLKIYGRLYTWNVKVDSRNICPTGWHVPSEAEWNILLSNVTSPAELKEAGNTHWFSPNTGATNSVSFTALPGGYYDGSVLTALQAIASFWFKDEVNTTYGRGFKLYYNNLPDTGDFVNSEKNTAFSVRCLKDN